MSQPLPIDGFRWLEKKEIGQLCEKIMELGVNDEKGYILEVDLEMTKINMTTLTTIPCTRACRSHRGHAE